MKDLEKFSYKGIDFQFVDGCGLAIVEEDGGHATTESFEEIEVRKELNNLMDKLQDYKDKHLSLNIPKVDRWFVEYLKVRDGRRQGLQPEGVIPYTLSGDPNCSTTWEIYSCLSLIWFQ